MIGRVGGEHTACYQDRVERHIAAETSAKIAANTLLAQVLVGCVQAHPWQVRVAMCMRNALVRPWRLRQSSIGCPVSSLLESEAGLRFAGIHPVRQIVRDDARHAAVVLGADDRHLVFRTSMEVERLVDGRMRISMTTSVQTRNRLGRIYMCLVDPLHRRWIAPAILDAALAHACAPDKVSDVCAIGIRRFAMK